MGIFVFIVGSLMLLGLGALVTYWIVDGDPEDYFYRSIGCITGMAALTIAFQLWGNHVFSAEAQKWILFSISVLMLLYIAFYIFGYIFICANDFEPRLLLLSIPALVELFLVVAVFVRVETIWSFFSSSGAWATVVAAILGAIGTVVSATVYSEKLRDTKKKLRLYQRRSDLSHFEDYDNFFMSTSASERANMEEVIVKIYRMLHEERLSPSRAMDYLQMADVPNRIAHSVVERIFETRLYRNASTISLTEFAQEVLPEYFRPDSFSKISYRNSSMDVRMFEEIYDKFQRLLRSERGDFAELKTKMEQISCKLEARTLNEQPAIKYESTAEMSCQTQIRELFHALETPIALTEMAVSNLQSAMSELTDDQKRKIARIQNNLKVIKCVLYAYRELTFMTIWSSENTFLPLPNIIHSIKDFLFEHQEHQNDLKIEVSGLPDSIPKYSTNLVTILVLPLLQNALEATPKSKTVFVRYSDTGPQHIVEIQNSCSKTPSQSNLDEEGFSSKGNAHIGTGISIVRRISSTVGIDFSLVTKNNQVIAKLSLPKKEQ